LAQLLFTPLYRLNLELQAINKDYNTAQLFNKLVNIFADLPDQGIKDVGLIKALTGEDTISARHIYGTPFDFINKAKMIFSTNNMPPNYGDKSDAFYERLIILPFNQQKKDGEKDPQLKYKLAEENDYIFMWALEGLKRLIKQNFIF
jgi:putative DNA primase/helicase